MQLKDLANLTDTLQILNKSVNIADTFNTLSLSMQKSVLASGQLSAEQINLIATSNIFSKSANGNKEAVSGLTLEEVKNAATNALVAESQVGTTATTLGLGTAFNGLWISIKNTTASLLKFLLTTPAGWATLAVGAFATAAAAIVNYNKQIEENKKKIREAAEEAKSTVDTIKSDFDTLSSDMDKVKKRYAELAQQVENLGKANQSRGELRTEDYEEFLDLSNQLSKLFPQLTQNYDDNGNAILNLSGNVDTIVGSLDDLVSVQQKLANQEIMKNMPAIWSGYLMNLKELNQELANYETYVDAYLEEVKLGEAGPSILFAPWDSLDFSEFLDDEDEYEKLINKLGKAASEYEDKVQLTKTKIASAKSGMTSYINTWLSTEWNYNKLDSNLQNAVKNMLFNGDWIDLIPDDIDSNDWQKVSEWLQDNILYQIKKVQENSDEISNALSEVFSNAELTPEAKASYIKQIHDYFGEESMVTILLQPQFEATEELQKQYDDAVSRFGENATDTLVTFFKEKSINDTSEIDYWNKVTESAESAEEAVNMYNEAKKNDPVLFSDQLTNSSDSLDKFQSSAKSAADAYATLLSGNCSSTELLDSIQAINQAVTDMGESIAWEDIDWKDIDSLDLLGDKLEEVSQKYAESILSGAGIDANSDFGQILTDIISQMYEAEAEFTGMNAQLDYLQSSYQTLTGILESYNETGHISLDNLQSLLTADENLIAMLEVENGQLVINQESYENLVAAQLLEFKAKLNDAAAAEIEALAKEKSEKATDNNAKASEEAVAKLDAETEAFKRNTEAVGENAITKAIEDAKEEGVSEEEIQRVLDKYTEIWNAAMDNYSADFPEFMNGAKSSGEAAGKSAGEAFTDALDKELAALDKNLEAGYIDFNDYIQSRLSLIEDYYNQGKLSADEYYSYLEKHYDTQLSYMDKAVNAVTRRIDTELDALKQQKEDVESLYNVQIESLEKEKTLLEEANKERQRQKDLQKSLYDLERAKNQRTKLVYSEDKGMQYVADDQSIRDAQENVDNARYDIQISKIEKSISNLEEARDKETDAIDEMISNLESYKDAWNDVTSAYEVEQENLFAAQILGADWEADILNGRLDVLNAFKNEYIRIQQEIADAALKSTNKQPKTTETVDTGGNPNVSKINFTEYASGTNNAKKGLNLVGEDGPEAYFDNHGHVAIVTKPTLIPMEGGEVVKNERDTKKLLDPDNLAPVDTIELADIDEKETLPDVRTLTPISLEEYIRELLQTASNTPKQVQTKQIYPENDLLQSPEKCAAAMERSLESMMNPMNLIVHNMQELTGMDKHMNHINNVSSVVSNNRDIQQPVNNTFNITMPNVTNATSAERLMNDLQSLSTKKFQVDWNK